MIGRRHFEELLQSSPALSLSLNRILGEQLRSSQAAASSARPRPATVALLSLDERVPIDELSRDLAEAVKGMLDTELLTDRQLDPAHAGDDPARVFAPLLDGAEGSHELVLLDAGALPDGSPWSEFCLQQADRILAFTSGGPVPEGLAGRSELKGCDLVLYDVVPGRLAAESWASALDPSECHVVRGDERAHDVARIARRLSGRSVGVVLSGGGARAFSHIGVLEELLGAGRDRRPRPRREHGGLRGRAVRDGARHRGDRRSLLRGVGPAPSARRLHLPALLADSRRAGRKR